MKKKNNILKRFSSQKGQIAVLIDPDKITGYREFKDFLDKVNFSGAHYLFIGGSSVTHKDFIRVIEWSKKLSKLPIVIFPGASYHISDHADAILYLSLISGRNPDYLIGQHIQSSNELYDMPIEVIPTAYLLIDGGTQSSVAYVSQTTPIPQENISIIERTCKAGLLQGKDLLYLDAGSGAKYPVSQKIINHLAQLDAPLIVGGGIKSKKDLLQAKNANVIVIGNKLEEDIDFLLDLEAFTQSSQS